MATWIGHTDGPPEGAGEFHGNWDQWDASGDGNGGLSDHTGRNGESEPQTPPGWAQTSDTTPTESPGAENGHSGRKGLLTVVGAVAGVAIAVIAWSIGRSGVPPEPAPPMSPTETVTVAASPVTVAAPTTDNRSAPAPVTAPPISATSGADIGKFLETMHGQNPDILGAPRPVVMVPGGDDELLLLANVACAAYEKDGGLAAVAAVKTAQPNITFSKKDPRLITDAPTFLELRALDYICP